MANGRRRPSLLGALLWIGIGVLFLLHNFGFVPDVWSIVTRYWPVLLILLGLGKLLEYFLKKNAVGVRIGEIFGILLLLLIGTAMTRMYGSQMGRFFRELPIQIGSTSVRPGEWFGDSHTYSEETTFPLESAAPIRIENSYGNVLVRPGSDREIRAILRKVVYEKDEGRAKSFAEGIHLQGGPEKQGAPGTELKPEAEPAEKTGAAVFVVRTNRDSLSSQNRRFNTDIEISVPRNSQVQVSNSYGEVRVAGINGKLDLSTIHRDLEVRDCTGEFTVSNRYAESRLINLQGNVSVDARGRVYIEKIKGDVAVNNEYSPVEILDVDGKLTVSTTERDLKIERVTKAVVITARGTRVQASDLRDSLKIAISHGNVDLSGVAAQVNLESRYATLSLKNIQGNIEIDSSADDINAEDLRGSFIVKARGSGVRANAIQGPLDIRTTLKDVVVNDFADSCSVSNEYADISISSGRLGKGAVNVKNRNGDIELFLPANAAFSIDATARNGKIESEYAGLDPVRSPNAGSLKSTVNGGGPRITLETDHSDIRLYSTEDGEGGEKRPAGQSVAVPSPKSRLAARRLALAERKLARAARRLATAERRLSWERNRIGVAQ